MITRANGLAVIVAFLSLAFLINGCQGGKIADLESQVNHYQQIVEARNKTIVFPEGATQEDVVKWWKDSWLTGHALGLMILDLELQHLRPVRHGTGYETYTLYKSARNEILLDVPTEAMGDERPAKCENNRSMLRVSGRPKGLAVDLNPRCSEVYGFDEVDIRLFWLSADEVPLVEIVTNGLACVPATLYRFNDRTGTYEKAAEKCGG